METKSRVFALFEAIIVGIMVGYLSSSFGIGFISGVTWLNNSILIAIINKDNL